MHHNPQRALPLLTDAEESLRKLIQQSLEADQYGDVARLAEVAALISRAIAILKAASSTPSERGTTERSGPQETLSRGPEQDRSLRPSTAGGAMGYPRFERDEDEILKVGWSKQKRKEYVHRAPRSVIWALARILRARSVPESRFMTTEILPLVNDGRGEVPSYQVYLALAWLRGVGAISGNGREGYLADAVGISDENVEALWEALPGQA